MKQLQMPPYEWLKALPLKRTVTRSDRNGHTWKEKEPCQYSFIVFNTPIFAFGHISYNEDDSRHIFFDVFEQGHTGMNDYGMALKFNKTNYKKICKHAQEVYEMFYRELDKDMSWQWERSPEEYFANEF